MFDDLLADEIEELEDEGTGSAVGIDLGTTNSVVAAVRDGRPVVFEDETGISLQPSVVAWLPNGDRVVGTNARLRRVIDPLNTVFSAKRIIGQPFGSERVQDAIRQLPYQVVEGQNQESLISTRAGAIPVPQVSAYVLEALRGIAGQRLGQAPSHCVVTVPANFSDGQRAATRRAAEQAGLEVLRVLNEPTAAAIAYGRDRKSHQRIAVFDLGGGTFDLSLLAVRDNVYEVIATGGDPFLGGDDMDRVLADRLAGQFLAEQRIDLNVDPTARARLLIAAEQIKMQLSRQAAVEGTIGKLAHGAGGAALGLTFRIERMEFEQMVWPTIERALRKAEQVLSEAQVSPAQVDEVILVGGSTSVPLVQRCVAERFGRQCRIDIDPMVVVAIGAAIQAQSLFSPGEDANVLLDVTPHAIRVATAGGFSQELIAKNTTIPAEGLRTFVTSRDEQTSVTVKIGQGEAARFDDNVPVGELKLDGLPPRPRGKTPVEVAFTIDADGILQVSAKDLASGRQAHAVLTTIGHSETR